MYMDYPIVPAGLREMYYKLSDFLSSMVDAEAASQPNEGGIMGTIKQTLSSCNIF